MAAIINIMKLLRFLGILLLVLIFVFVPLGGASVYAQGQFPGDEGPSGIVPCEDNCNACDLVALSQDIINFLVYLSIFAATIAIVWAGFLYVKAQGSPGEIQKAHKIFGTVIVGLIIVLAAWLFVNLLVTTFVNPKLVGGGQPTLENILPWNQIECKRIEANKAAQQEARLLVVSPSETDGQPTIVTFTDISTAQGYLDAVRLNTLNLEQNASLPPAASIIAITGALAPLPAASTVAIDGATTLLDIASTIHFRKILAESQNFSPALIDAQEQTIALIANQALLWASIANALNFAAGGDVVILGVASKPHAEGTNTVGITMPNIPPLVSVALAGSGSDGGSQGGDDPSGPGNPAGPGSPGSPSDSSDTSDSSADTSDAASSNTGGGGAGVGADERGGFLGGILEFLGLSGDSSSDSEQQQSEQEQTDQEQPQQVQSTSLTEDSFESLSLFEQNQIIAAVEKLLIAIQSAAETNTDIGNAIAEFLSELPPAVQVAVEVAEQPIGSVQISGIIDVNDPTTTQLSVTVPGDSTQSSGSDTDLATLDESINDVVSNNPDIFTGGGGGGDDSGDPDSPSPPGDSSTDSTSAGDTTGAGDTTSGADTSGTTGTADSPSPDTSSPGDTTSPADDSDAASLPDGSDVGNPTDAGDMAPSIDNPTAGQVVGALGIAASFGFGAPIGGFVSAMIGQVCDCDPVTEAVNSIFGTEPDPVTDADDVGQTPGPTDSPSAAPRVVTTYSPIIISPILA